MKEDRNMSKSEKGNKDKVCSSKSANVKNRENTSSCGRQRAYSLMKERNGTKVDFADQMRPRTCSMPSRNTIRKLSSCPGLQKYKGQFVGGSHTYDVDTYVVRSFEVNSKGVIKSRSDSLRSRSTASFSSEGEPCPLSQSSVFSNSSLESITNGNTDFVASWSVRVFGMPGVGKTALTQQFMTSEYLGGFNTSLGRCITIVNHFVKKRFKRSLDGY